MPDRSTSDTRFYHIRIQGQLDGQWTDWFEGLSVTLQENGDTILCGPVADQAALHGLLRKVRDLGMPLVSVIPTQVLDIEQSDSKKEKQMNLRLTTAERIDTKVLLSTLWAVVMINMLKADILSLFIPGVAEEMARTSASTGLSIPQLMLTGAILGQIGIAMIILSRVLKYEINRRVNIVAGAITIAYIWGGMASFPHYLFIVTVETLCLLLIIGFAWTWRNSEV